METKLYWIPGPWKGRLAIAPRPRGGDWTPDEMKSWRDQSVTVIVSLLDPAESREFELQDEKEIAEQNGLNFIGYSIPDRGIPSSGKECVEIIDKIYRSLETGENVVVHCRQGIGRSGLIAAALFIVTGNSVEKAIQHVSRFRGVSIPETEAQREWLNRIAPVLRGEDQLRLRA